MMLYRVLDQNETNESLQQTKFFGKGEIKLSDDNIEKHDKDFEIFKEGNTRHGLGVVLGIEPGIIFIYPPMSSSHI